MLALDRPLGVVGGLVLVGDHADPRRVYFTPTRPNLARVGGRAELGLLRFRADAAEQGAGLLSFTTELVATDDQLEAAREHLADLDIDQPIMSGFPWIAGRASLAAALAEGDGFVERLLGDTVPDLAGNGRAVFSALLDERGVALAEALLSVDDGISPLGVRYELEYLGMRPAFDVRLRADYSRVYDEFAAGFQFGVAYQGVGVRAGVETATRRLVELGAIEVEVLHFTDDASLQSQVDAAVRWFQDHIVERFFASRLGAPQPSPDLAARALEAALALGVSSLASALADADVAARLAERLGVPVEELRRVASGAAGAGAAGAGAAGGATSTFALNVQFELREIREEELGVVTLDWTQARAERRTAAPQGLLTDLDAELDVTEAPAGDPIWERLRVDVRPLGDFEALGADRMVVEIAYPDEHTAGEGDRAAIRFEAADLEPQRFQAWTDGRGFGYRTRTEVHFRDDGPWPGPPLHRGSWQSHDQLDLAIHPLDDVERVEVSIEPGTVDFGVTPQVQIDLRIDGLPSSVMLTAESPRAVFRHRFEPGDPRGSDTSGGGSATATPAGVDGGRPDPSAVFSRVESRSTWFLGGGASVVGDWQPLEGPVLLVRRPFRSERSLRLMPMLPDDVRFAIATVDLTGEHSSPAVEIEFDTTNPRSVVVRLPSLAVEPPPAQIHVLVVRADSTVFEQTLTDVDDPVVMIADRDGPHRRVSVRLVAGDRLADSGVIAVQVQLLDRDDRVVDTVNFSQTQREPALLLVPIGDSNRMRYRVVRYGLDAGAVVSSVVDTTEDEILVPAAIG